MELARSVAGQNTGDERLRGEYGGSRGADSLGETCAASVTAERGELVMKKIGYALGLAIAIASVGAASAADLPTKKDRPAAPKPNCFASFWTWLDSSATDCPLSAGPITVYGTIDLGGGYISSGAERSPVTDKMAYGIQKYSNSPRWQANLQRPQHQCHRHQAETGPRPPRGARLVVDRRHRGGRQSLFGHVRQRPAVARRQQPRFTNKHPFQGTNLDSSRAGQWDNSQGYLGISNNTYGTLTFGRTNSLAFDSLAAYDPVSSVAFSLIGFSNSFPGFGDTETVRPNTAFTYRLNYQNFRIAAQAQIGGYGARQRIKRNVSGAGRRRLPEYLGRHALIRRHRIVREGRGVPVELLRIEHHLRHAYELRDQHQQPVFSIRTMS